MVLVALAGLVFLAGCNDDTNSVSQQPTATLQTAPRQTTSTSTEPTTTTTTKPPSVKDQVEAAYLKAVSTYYAIARQPDPDDKGLAATRSGPSLARARQLLSGFRKSGIEVRYVDDRPPVPRVLSVKAMGVDRAFVTACLVDNARQVRVADGTVVDDAVVSRLDRAELRRMDEVWRMHGLEALNRWKDGEGCDR